jgi:hypothetical protein
MSGHLLSIVRWELLAREKKKEIGEQSHSPSIPIDFEVGARFFSNGSEGGKIFCFKGNAVILNLAGKNAISKKFSTQRT